MCMGMATWNQSQMDRSPMQPESDNVFDEFAVSLREDNTIVGHILKEISIFCLYFLQKRHSRSSVE